MTPRVWVSEIEFSDGKKIELDKNDIIVFVGPNNAGKSASLKNISELLWNRDKKNKLKVVKDIVIEKEGEISDLISFLKIKSLDSEESNPTYVGYNYEVYGPSAMKYWNEYKYGLSELSRLFINTLTTEGRLSAANPANNIKITSDVLRHPIHFLQKDDSLEEKFNEYFKQAFDKDLMLHRNAGSEVPFYVGDKPIPKDGEDRQSIGYLREIEKQDTLLSQGDGMRSFVGVLLSAFISEHSILFIDEPEAFLHPPQARLLGKMLAKDLPMERQLFLATHSEDFLKGLIDADKSNLKIIRIQRNDNINIVSVLENSEIKKIWDDSLLRHSNILSGLFHSKVVVCESDSDCQFYSSMFSEGLNIKEAQKDVLFIHCGGKHRVPVAIATLKKLDVPLKVISDFDVLNDETPLRQIYEGLGGMWSEVEKDWKLVKGTIDAQRPELLTEDFRKEIEKIISSVEVTPKNWTVK